MTRDEFKSALQNPPTTATEDDMGYFVGEAPPFTFGPRWYNASWVKVIEGGIHAETGSGLYYNDPYDDLPKRDGGPRPRPATEKYLHAKSAAELYRTGSLVERLHVVRLLQPTTKKITPDDKWAYDLWTKIDPVRVPAYNVTKWLGYALLQYVFLALLVAAVVLMSFLGWRESFGFVVPGAINAYVIISGVAYRAVTSYRVKAWVVAWLLRRAYPQKLVEEREEYLSALALGEMLG